MPDISTKLDQASTGSGVPITSFHAAWPSVETVKFELGSSGGLKQNNVLELAKAPMEVVAEIINQIVENMA